MQKSPVVEIVKKVSPAVVSIIISKDLPKIRKYYIQPFDEFLGPYGPPITQYRQEGKQRVRLGGGSGFFVLPEGIILTNRHVVVSPHVDYTVVTAEGKEYQAEVLARDAVHDVAILKIKNAKNKKFPVLELGDSNQVELGQSVIAIGNALGAFQNTVSTGVVSGLSRFITATNIPFGQTEQL
jgi:S1-C subfamily serine protease